MAESLTEPTPGMLPFLAAVRAAPADDLPRLVFADWLEERGYGTWAELTRVQCELGRAPCQAIQYQVEWGEPLDTFREIASGDDEWVIGLLERERACLARPGELPTFPTARPGLDRVEFERGLPCLRWGGGPPPGAAAVPAGHFSWIDTLYVHYCLPADIPRLGPVLGRAMRWGYSNFDQPDRAEVPLARWRRMPALGRLRDLYLSLFGQPDRRAAFLALTRWPLPHLDGLRLFVGADTDDRMTTRLAGAPWPALRELQLRNTALTPAGFVRVADRLGPRLRRLEAPAGATTEVFLAQCRHGLLLGEGWLPAAADPAACARALAACPRAADLSSLVAAHPGLGDDELLLLAGSPHLRHVRHLNLDRTRVTDGGLAALAGSPMMGRLSRLTLSRTDIGDRGVRALAGSPAARRLRQLNLDETRVTAGAAATLAGSPHLGRLGELSMQGNRLTPDARKRLRERFGRGNVHLAP